MKKITKTTKAPAPATKITAPAPARKSSIAPKIIKKPAAAPAAEPMVVKPKASKVTVTATIDIGFGNTLFIRGSGAGLTWEKGKALAYTAGNAWTLVLPAVDKPFAFKFLVNDEAWSADPNYEAAPGDTVTVTPVF
jgi:hypothetical protein